MTGRERVLADATARGIEVEFIERPAAGSLEEAAGLLGLPASSVIKTLVVKRHDGDFLFALVPGDRQISWGKLRTVVGVNKLKLPDATVALHRAAHVLGVPEHPALPAASNA